MSDREDDQRLGINSSACFGDYALLLPLVFSACTVFLLGWLVLLCSCI